MDLQELRNKHDAYNANLVAQGIKMLSTKMPCCGYTLLSRKGEAGRQWDTLATCPGCGGLYMKITTETELIARLPE